MAISSWTRVARFLSISSGAYFLQRTTTGSDGSYRIPDLYAGANNYVWITKEGYDVVAMPAVPTCDYCNQIVTLNADTRLDIELIRR